MEFKFFSDLELGSPKGIPNPHLTKPFTKDKDEEEDSTNRTTPKNTPEKAYYFSNSLSPKLFRGIKKTSSKGMVDVILNSNDWVFTQATALSSVDVESDGHTIRPSTGKHINDNGNTWTKAVIRKWYKTFIGAHNYVDHTQEPSESRGIVLDSVLREVASGSDSVYYVDTLIATNRRRDPLWAAMIESGKVRYLSMGSVSSGLQCSQCGKISEQDSEDCEHLGHLGYNYIDRRGVKRPVAAIITDKTSSGEPGYMAFVELSYLSVSPAYKGAIQGHILDVPENTELHCAIPQDILCRSAFQKWRGYMKNVPFSDTILQDSDLRPEMFH